ncbi:MAG TPA: radical SAM family heme chaperone HemW [Candidatus Sulfotelmatobacter sp.]
MPLGLYISVPFCRTKCSYCNFASDVFSRAVFERYVERVCADVEAAAQTVAAAGGEMPRDIDSVYLGGGTPTILDPGQLQRIFGAVQRQFSPVSGTELTVECAPGTLRPDTVQTLLRCGVNRVSLGVQSFVDAEAAAVGRLHKRTTILEDIALLRASGITNINIDLIAGLPHQTAESWLTSVTETIATGVPHVSVYMLEVDDESRLGRELIAGGRRYHAHFVRDEDATADFYLEACEKLNAAGIWQYEISNFARDGFHSKHNLKYWTRRPYLGFGVDAHSMLPSSLPAHEAVRFASADSLEKYLSGPSLDPTFISAQAALEETLFLGLRLNCGISLKEIAIRFGAAAFEGHWAAIEDLVESQLLERQGENIRLTPRGRLLSNEVFERFLSPVAT